MQPAHGQNDDMALLARFDEILIESYPREIEEVLGDVRERLEQLIKLVKPVDEEQFSKLENIISYPGNLLDEDIKALEAIRDLLKTPPKI